MDGARECRAELIGQTAGKISYTSLIEVCLSEIMPFPATWRDVEMIILSEGSQTEKDKLPMISLNG